MRKLLGALTVATVVWVGCSDDDGSDPQAELAALLAQDVEFGVDTDCLAEKTEELSDEHAEFLIDNVGHERNNATAEVRRSVSGAYGPLYQAAYMLGGLQIRAMHRELVQSGRMTNRDFHDAVLRNNSIPIEMTRAAITDQPLNRDFESSWLFYGDVAADPP